MPDGTSFIPTDITPDGTALVGYTRMQGQQSSYFVDAVFLPSLVAHHLYTMPGDAAPPTVKTDGTYAAMIGGNNFTGGPGPLHQLIGFFNIQSFAYNILYDTNTLRYNPYIIAVDHGQFFWNLARSPGQLSDMDMASSNISIVPMPNGTFDGTATIQVVWPHLLYVPNDQMVHIYNLQTQQDMVLSMIPMAGMPQLVGSGVVWAQPDPASGGTAIQTIADVDQANPAAQAVTVLHDVSQMKQLAATPRLIAWDDGTTFSAYDRQKQVVVTLHAKSATPLPITTLAAHGDQL